MTSTRYIWEIKVMTETDRDWLGETKPTPLEKRNLTMRAIDLDIEIAQHLEWFADIQDILKRSDLSNEDKLGYIREICDEGLDSIQPSQLLQYVT